MPAPIVPIPQGFECLTELVAILKSGTLASKQRTAGADAGAIIIALSQNVLTDQPDVTPIGVLPVLPLLLTLALQAAAEAIRRWLENRGNVVGASPEDAADSILARNTLAEIEFLLNDAKG